MEMKQEPDQISKKAVVLGTLVLTVVSAAFVLAAWALDEPAGPEVTSPWQVIPEEVNQIEVARFDEATAAERQTLAAGELLTSYGWVDQEAGVIRIPIERAIEIYLSRVEGK